MAQEAPPINQLKINTNLSPVYQPPAGQLDALFDPKLEARTPVHLLNASFWSASLGISPEQATTYLDTYNKAFLGEDASQGNAWTRIKDNFANGKKMVALADLGNKAMKGQATDDDFAEIEFLKRGLRQDWRYAQRAWWDKALSDTAEQIPLMGTAMAAGGAGAVAGGMLFGGVTAVATAVDMIPGDEAAIGPAFWAGVKFGGTSGTAVRAGQLEAGGAYLDLLDEGIDPKIAAQIAAPIGIINGLIEAGQMMTLISTIPGLNQVGKGVMTRALRKTITKIVKDQTLTNLAKHRLARFGGYLATETLQEINQETTAIIGEALGKAINNELRGTELPQATLDQIKDRYIEIASKSLRSFAVLGAPGTIAGAGIDVVRKRSRKQGSGGQQNAGSGQTGRQGDEQGVVSGAFGQGAQTPGPGQDSQPVGQSAGPVVDQPGGTAEVGLGQPVIDLPSPDADGWLTLQYDSEEDAKADADWIKREAGMADEAVEVDVDGTSLRVRGDSIGAITETLKELVPRKRQAMSNVMSPVSDRVSAMESQVRLAIEGNKVYLDALADQQIQVDEASTVNQAAVAKMKDSTDPQAGLLALQWEMVQDGYFTAKEINQATREMVAEYEKTGLKLGEPPVTLDETQDIDLAQTETQSIALPEIKTGAELQAVAEVIDGQTISKAARQWGVKPNRLTSMIQGLDAEQVKSQAQKRGLNTADFLSQENAKAGLPGSSEAGTIESDPFNDPDSEESIAYETREAYQEAFQAVEKAIQRVSETEQPTEPGLERAAGRGPSLLRERLEPGTSGVLGDWRRHRRIDYTGRVVFGPQAVAELFAVYRHPRIEQFHIIYVDDQGQILGHNMMSSGLSTVSQAVEAKNWTRVSYLITHRMKRLGATGYYLVHNHPSGNFTPSEQDLQVTTSYNKAAPGLIGHIVLDDTEFSVIKPLSDTRGTVNVLKYGTPQKRLSPSTAGKIVPDSNEENIAFLAHPETNRDTDVLLFMNGQNEVVAWEPAREVVNPKVLHQKARNYGAAALAVATENDQRYVEWVEIANAVGVTRLDYFYNIIQIGSDGQVLKSAEKRHEIFEGAFAEKQRAETMPSGFVWEDAPKRSKGSFKERLADFVVNKLHEKQDAKQMAEDLVDHPGQMEFMEFMDKYGQELADPKSAWMAKWVGQDISRPRQIHKRLQAEYASLQARVAGKTPAADIPIKDLSSEQIPEISILDISTEVTQQEKAQTLAQLIDKAMGDARLIYHVKSTLRNAFAQGKKAGIEKLKSHYKDVMIRARARRMLREQVGQWVREITKRAGANVAFEQRETINAIQDHLDPKWRSQATLVEREKSRRWLADNPQAMVPRSLIKLLNKTAVNEMTVAQIESLALEVKKLRHQGLNKRRLQQVQKMRSRMDVAKDLMESLGTGDAENNGPIVASTQRRGAGDIGKTAWLGTLRPARLFDLVDRSKRFAGAWVKTFVDQINKATDAKLRVQDERLQKGLKFLESLDMTANDLQRVRVLDQTEYTAQELIGIYNFMRNPLSALAIRFGNRISDRTIDRVRWHVENEDPRLKKIADFMIEEFDSNWARLREATIAIFDRDLGRETNYMPMIRTEGDLTADERQIETELMQRMGLRKGVAESGFTRDRVEMDPEYQKPIRLEAWDIWTSAVAAQEHLINMGQVTKELHLTLGNKDMQNALNARFGKNARPVKDMLKHYIDRVANPNIFKNVNEYEKLLKTMRHNVAIAYLAYNVVTMLKQLPSVLFYLPYCGVGQLMSSAAEFATNPKAAIAFVHARDPQVAHVVVEREIQELAMAKGKNWQRVKARIGSTGMQGIMLLDQVARCIGWKASYNKAIAQGLAEDEAVLYAQRATLLTQPAGAAKDLPDLYTRNEVLNMFLMFTNQLNQIWNMGTYDAVAQWKNKDFQSLAMMTFGVGLSGVIMWSVSNRRLPEDPDDIMDAIGETAMNSLPLFGRGVVAMNNGWTDPVQVPALEAPIKIMKGLQDFNARQVLEGLSLVGGIPYTQPRRVYKTLKNEDMWELIGGPPKEKK